MNKMKKASIYLIPFAAFFLFGSCAPKSGLISPQVELSGLNVKGVSLSHITYTATLGIYNPNNFDIHVDSIKYTLYLNGSKFMDGADSMDIKIGPHEDKKIKVRLSGSLFNALRLLSSLSREPRIDFEMKGAIRGRSSGIGPGFSVPFEEKGNFDFNDLNPGIPLNRDVLYH